MHRNTPYIDRDSQCQARPEHRILLRDSDHWRHPDAVTGLREAYTNITSASRPYAAQGSGASRPAESDRAGLLRLVLLRTGRG
eukprot:98790-Hanusia_phi.AAC.1